MTTANTRLALALLGLLQVPASCTAERSASPASATVIVLSGARVIDGTGRPPIESATIVIDEGRVVAVGSVDDIQPPVGAEQIDLSGRTVIPGLVNTHAHLNSGDPQLSMREQLLTQLRLYASYGVTTVQSLTDDGVESVAVRDTQAGGVIDGARLFVSGSAIMPRSVGEVSEAVDGHAGLGVDIIKTKLDGRPNDMTPEVYSALIERAHERGLRVAAHIFYLEDALGLVNAGVDVIAHSVRDQDVDAGFVAELKRRGVGYIPTLTRDLSLFVYETRPAFFDDPFFLRGVEAFAPNRGQIDRLEEPARQERARNSTETQSIKAALAQAQRNVKLLVDGGVMVAMGTDSGTSLGRWQGYFEHVELELMVEAGLTPMQVLVAATGDAARVLQLDDVGTLEPGKWADLVVLTADPLADIRNTREIEAVWIAGRPVNAPIR